MKPKRVWKAFFQSSGENATSRVLGLRLSDSRCPGGGGLRVSLKISNRLYTLSPEKNHEFGSWGRAQGNQTENGGEGPQRLNIKLSGSDSDTVFRDTFRTALGKVSRFETPEHVTPRNQTLQRFVYVPARRGPGPSPVSGGPMRRRPLPEPRTREPEAAQEGAWIFTFYGKGASPDLISDP